MPKDIKLPRTPRKTPYPDRPHKPTPKSQQDRGEERQHASVNELKRRIRDVKRLLAKPDLSADKRVIQERALAGYEKELADEERRRERSRMIKKYHFVRFLDRKTATKEVKRLTKKRDELAKDADIDEPTKQKKLELLNARLHMANVNLNYTIYYPLTEKYLSIYAEKKKSKGQDEDGDEDVPMEEGTTQQEETVTAATTAEKKAMLQTVEKCMQDGTLDLLREGKLNSNADSGTEGGMKTETKSKSKSKTLSKDTGGKAVGGKEDAKSRTNTPGSKRGKSAKQSAKHAAPAPAESDGESDGGFFEI
ncbi:hypothetical protein BDV11DRAFT_71329 [Aspergillus similis]